MALGCENSAGKARETDGRSCGTDSGAMLCCVPDRFNSVGGEYRLVNIREAIFLIFAPLGDSHVEILLIGNTGNPTIFLNVCVAHFSSDYGSDDKINICFSKFKQALAELF